MPTSVKGIVVLLVIAAVCGGLGRAIAGGGRGGLFTAIVIGFIGAWMGSFIARYFSLPDVLAVGIEGHNYPVLWSIAGSALFVTVVQMFAGRPQGR
jgi:uncharacterized membrane protein YeaQ/YmgE (transglycosylase-associated protein family)